MYLRNSLLTGVALLIITSQAFAEERYLGAEACAECHQLEYKTSLKDLKTGEERKLPNSLKYLQAGVVSERVKEYRTPEKQKVATEVVVLDPEKNYAQESACLTCHSTGFGNPTGYSLDKLNPQLSGVTCEACHGAGSGYLHYMEKASETGKYDHYEGVRLGVTNLHDEKEKVCLTCHKKNKICPVIAGIGERYQFDYEKRAKLVHKMKQSEHSHEHKHHHDEHSHHHDDD